MMYIVSYDITSDKRRRKIANTLEDYGKRVQYSVFECNLNDKRFTELYSKMVKLTTDMDEGSVIFYPMCSKCADKVQVIGTPVPTIREDGGSSVIVM
ncbi:MAG: CRISPR-associated endonuclease Cas2 [Lachnospiraceae bacterium]|nr:CRISPR-associated endonuclease Cas2 [Lachnospiraceae bacterium]